MITVVENESRRFLKKSSMSLKTIQGIFKIKFQNFKTILPEFKTKSPKKNQKI